MLVSLKAGRRGKNGEDVKEDACLDTIHFCVARAFNWSLRHHLTPGGAFLRASDCASEALTRQARTQVDRY